MKDLIYCPCCCEEHERRTVRFRQNNIYKGVPVEYDAEHTYCPVTDEMYSDERQMTQNWERMREAYARKAAQ